MNIISSSINQNQRSAWPFLSNDNELNLYKDLQKLAENLLISYQYQQYQSLYFRNKYLHESIIKYRGTLIFLSYLGYKPTDETNQVFICNKVDKDLIESCIESIKYRHETCQDKKEPHPLYPDKKDWICPFCTLLNSYKLTKCEACNASREQPRIFWDQYTCIGDPRPWSNEKTVKEWECSSCRVINDVTECTCFVCYKPKNYADDTNNVMSDGYNNYHFNANDYHSVQETESKQDITITDFQAAAEDILFYNDSALSVISTLRSVAKKLLKDDARHRTLDTTNPRVMERLIGYDGVLDFLMLLGFKSDALGMKLTCAEPKQKLMYDAITALNECQARYMMKKVENKADENDLKDVNNDDNNDEDIIWTVDSIINYGTHETMQGNHIMETLILTHKMFTDSVDLMKRLRKRFMIPIPYEILQIIDKKEKEQKIEEYQIQVLKIIHLKTIKTLRDWIRHYWMEDFHENKELQKELREWMLDMANYDKLDIYNNKCVWITKLYNAMDKILKRQKVDAMEHKSNEEYKAAMSDELTRNLFEKSTAEALADQITLMEFEGFCKIKDREWLKNCKKPMEIPMIKEIIERNWNLYKFVQITILAQKTLRRRGITIRKIIKIGEHLKRRNNYQSLNVIYFALTSAPIHRLRIVWQRVPERNRLNMEQWKSIFKNVVNDQNMKRLMRSSLDKPFIPCIYALIEDMLFVNESKRGGCFGWDKYKGINFKKCIKMAQRISRIKIYQSNGYKNIKVDNKIQLMLRNEFEKVSDITEDQIWDMSTDVKKMDHRASKGTFLN